MFARYLSVVSGLDVPAVLCTVDERLHPNRLGEPLVDSCDARSVVRDRCLDARAHGELRECRLGDRQMLVLPLFDERERVDAVLVADLPLERVPAILHALQMPMRHFAQMIHEVPQAVILARPSGEVDLANGRFYAIGGNRYSGRTPQEVFHQTITLIDRVKTIERWKRGTRGTAPFRFQTRLETVAGVRTFDLQARPVCSGPHVVKWVATLIDVEEEESLRRTLTAAEADQRFLAELGRIFSEEPTTEAIVAAIVRLGADRGESWSLTLGRAASFSPDVSEADRETLATAFADERACVAGKFRDGRRFVTIRFGRGEFRGALSIVGRRVARDVGRLTQALAETVTARLVTELQRRGAAQRERHVAQRLQDAMLPTDLPSLDGCACSVSYVPATGDTFVGGDWYDVVDLGLERVAITIGDVAGHGLEAAIVMGTTRTLIRAAARENGDPVDVVRRVNRALCDDEALATALVGVFDRLTGEFSYVYAGHPPAYVVAPDGDVDAVPGEGLMLGISTTLRPQIRHRMIAIGEAVVCYTDGIIESSRDAIASDRVLQRALSEWARRDFQGGVASIQHAVVGSGPRADDAAILAFTATRRDSLDVTVPATPEHARRLRIGAERLLLAGGIDPARAFEIALAVGEAANNVVAHAYGGAAGTMTLVLAVADGEIAGSVVDRGRWKEPNASGASGNGMKLIRSLVPETTIRTSAVGTVASFRLVVAGSPPEAPSPVLATPSLDGARRP